MDFLKILESLKEKTLDLRDFEILKHAYETQQENFCQLKETSQLWKEKAERQEKEIVELQKELEALRKRAASDEFEEIPGGVLIKRLEDTYSMHAYCPNCKLVMGQDVVSHVAARRYTCPECGLQTITESVENQIIERINEITGTGKE